MAKKKTEEPVKEAVKITGPGGVPIVTMEPQYEFIKAVQLWQGAPKTGKTSTAAALGKVAKKLGIPDINPFFLLFESGAQGIDVQCTSEPCTCKGRKGCPDCGGKGIRRKVLRTLEEMDQWFTWAASSPFNPIVIDTGDAMFQAVSDGVCERLGIRAPHETDHGVAWTDIYDEMREKFAILTAGGKGIIILMHVYMQEKRVRGGTISTATFNVSGKTRPYMAGMANQILHFCVEPDAGGEDRHVIVSQPRSGVEAGDQWGLFPPELDRGKSAEEGAEAILKCFYEV